MFRVKVHNLIERLLSFLYRVGIWHREDKDTVAAWKWKLFYSIYNFLFPLSIATGAHASKNMDEKIYSIEMAIITGVFLVKLLYIIWTKKEVLDQLHRICEYCVEDQETFTQINNELTFLMKFVATLLSLCSFSSLCIALVIPFMGTEKKFFVNIGFPLDWRNDEFAYWIAFTFYFTEVILLIVSLLFPPMVWYLMANCGLRYVVLGQQIKNMGELKSVGETVNISSTEKDNLYLRDLTEAITSHQHLEELTKNLDSYLSKMFVVILTTSSLCICASVYCLAFNRGDNLIELVIYLTALLYNVFDIYMIMCFGNEILLASDRLSYSLFESDWVERSQSIKKNVLIFGELLMNPHQLVVLKLYPLNLETFKRICNSAYSMFSILQNLK